MTEPADNLLLKVSGLQGWYGESHILHDVDLTVNKGEVVTLLGRNGAGKTTLLQVILGLVPAATGSVRGFGRKPGVLNKEIGYVPQRYDANAAEAIRARDSVLLGLTGRRWGFARPNATDRAAVDDALAWVDATEIADRRLSELSGGQRQRIAIAAALVSRPRMLILDEPLASLDLRNQHEIVTLLGRLKVELGVTILVVAHDLGAQGVQARQQRGRRAAHRAGGGDHVGEHEALLGPVHAARRHIGHRAQRRQAQQVHQQIAKHRGYPR